MANFHIRNGNNKIFFFQRSVAIAAEEIAGSQSGADVSGRLVAMAAVPRGDSRQVVLVDSSIPLDPHEFQRRR